MQFVNLLSDFGALRRIQDESAQFENIMEDIPSTPEQISTTLLASVGNIWEQFLEQVPLLIAGMIVLLLTWGIVEIARPVADTACRQTILAADAVVVGNTKAFP